MDYTVYRLNLDKSTQRSQAVVKCFKGDTMVKLVCMLTNQGKVLDIDDGNVARLVLTVPGEEKLDHACYIKDNTIVYVFNDDTTSQIAESGRIEAQLFVYSGITYDGEGNPKYPNTSIAPRFSIEVAKADESQTDPIFAGINESVGIVMGAAAAEKARDEAESARDTAEKERQTSYTEAKIIATEARTTSQRAVSTSSEALSKAQQSNTIANGAKGTADLANIAAEEAKGVADEAKRLARNASNAVDSISFDYNSVTGLITLSYKLDENSEPRVFPVDLPVESLITMVSDRKDDKGRVYLDLHLRDGSIKSVLLNDITEGFVKTSTETNSLYATDESGKAVMVPIEKSSYSNTANAVPRRNALGGLSVSKIPAMDSDATSKYYVDTNTQEKLPENPSYSSHQMIVEAPIGFTDAEGNEVKMHLKRLNSGKPSVGIVTKYNRDQKLADGLITEEDYENPIDRDELTEWSVPIRTPSGQLVAEDGTEAYSVVNKKQLDGATAALQKSINSRVSKLNNTKTYPLVYADMGKDSSGNTLGDGYLICSEGNGTNGIPEGSYRQLPRFSNKGTLKGNDPEQPFDLVNKRTLEAALANAVGGSAKLYLHEVTIYSNYGEEAWMDNPYFGFTLTIYRTNDTPITSLSEIKDGEFCSFTGNQFNLWDAPEASRLAFSISKYGNYFTIYYLESINEYEGVVCNSQTIEQSYISVRDIVTEV